jgi:predicted HAD superfamily hydrolase
MVKYLKSQYSFVRYEKSTKAGKMYTAILKNKQTDREVKIHFGDNKMGNYQDKTGLNAYPKLTLEINKNARIFDLALVL